ncbi:MAG: 3-phosphoshikimate 1-carboxyvinyltransferase [Betaproteobacteria bacterium]|nr:3-phosphoshikimate 1-carboxyvinyltransferase [Betaproteobacteria bacterium]
MSSLASSNPDFLDLPAVSKAAGSLRLPGSKSISNRCLLLAGLAKGATDIFDLLDSDDTRVMLTALRTLGVTIETFGRSKIRVTGCAGTFPVKQADLFLGNAGTAFRPLTAALALSQGTYRLSGVPRMHERPIADLIDALRNLGAAVRYLEKEGFPPLAINPGTLSLGEPIRVRGDVSSQFLTALLMALPMTGRKTRIEVIGELISKPYIDITLNLMRRFGIEIEHSGWQHFTIAGDQAYLSPGEIHVEGDASAASYFLAAGVIGGGPVRVVGVGRASIQGDVAFADTLRALGAKIDWGNNWIEAGASLGQKLKAFDGDFNHIPDAAMTLAVLALFADGPCVLRNIASWRVKETDRINAMATELRKLGAEAEAGADFLRITPPGHLNDGVAIDTYDDHRMAMCFSLVSLGQVNIRINQPDCVAKTFPNYFGEFAKLVR